MSLIIATRKSMLAQAQADKILGLIKDKHNILGEKLLIVTEGDKRLDVTLDKIGGKGVFTKEIELALLDLSAHAAVHSMKDVPYALGEAFEIAAIPEREDVRDAFISSDGVEFKHLKKGARIGTSSIRRAAQLKALRSDIEILPLRGNVQTRIEKMHKEKLDGIILASAGLKRLGIDDIVTNYFDAETFLPAVGQGALGIETLVNSDKKHLFKALDNKEVRYEVEAERSFMRTLNGGCHSLIGAYGKINGNELYLIGTYEVNGKIVKKDISGHKEDNIRLGEELAKKILLG
ncbi:hydroxymethylbilane synthase [Clostridium paridis]|uniref:Porphobilinogen deaminase n=1 Tax=Clostridium paridis TaxID=2803863 RepID=A0A937K6B4_9CLOT|nr:hydroxymethylbilane synthase [Clostridium paridis]MBL4933450.1 hydroxymethylbilane synthase [Clostridium paridis]